MNSKIKNLMILGPSFHLVLFGFSLTIPFIKAQDNTHKPVRAYDEIYDDLGNIRPTYRNLIPIIEKKSGKEISKIKKLTTKDFTGDNSLLHFPRVLTERENTQLQAGVVQRARAISAFLKDHYSGKKLYDRDGIIPATVVEQIQRRSQEDHLNGKINPNNLIFWYGPDIIRGPDGDFYIIEDNPGYVGGVGDLTLAKKSLLKRVPEFADLFNSPSPTKFYEELVQSYQKMSLDGGKVVLIRYNNKVIADNEDKRIEKIFAKLGVETVVIRHHKDDLKYPNTLKVDNNGVFYRDHISGIEEKVGFIILDGESSDLDPLHESVFNRYIAESARSILDDFKEKIKSGKVLSEKNQEIMNQLQVLLSTDNDSNSIDIKGIQDYLRTVYKGYSDKAIDNEGFRGLLQAFYAGKVNMVNPPGLEFIGDKEIAMLMDKLIKYYLNETPIIKAIPTRSFRVFNNNGKGQIDENLVDEIFSDKKNNQSRFVVKRVDGRGGNAVWVGAKISSEEFNSIIPDIRSAPEAFIVQEYFPLSQVDGHIVDLRYHSQVSTADDNVIVAPVPWGRGVKFKGGNGKVNISDQGGELAVLIAPNPVANKKRKLIAPQEDKVNCLGHNNQSANQTVFRVLTDLKTQIQGVDDLHSKKLLKSIQKLERKLPYQVQKVED